jgi:hypothetical protein
VSDGGGGTVRLSDVDKITRLSDGDRRTGGQTEREYDRDSDVDSGI